MTRLICCISGKGGVGKTTIVSNLAATLAYFGEDTIAMDANLTTPNLGLHVGMHLTSNTLHHVLRGESRLMRAIYPHPYGFKVIPSSLNLNDLRGVDVGRLPEITFSLLGKADYVVLDCAAGLGREALSALSASDEVIIVTNPNLPAVTDALKILKVAQESDMKIIGTVVNRIKGERHELSIRKIEKILDVPIIARIPEDENVPKSIENKKLLLEYAPTCPAAEEIKRLTAWLTNRVYEPEIQEEPVMPVSLWDRFVNWLSG